MTMLTKKVEEELADIRGRGLPKVTPSSGAVEVPPQRAPMLHSMERMRDQNHQLWDDYIEASRRFAADLRNLADRVEHWIGTK